MQPNPTQLNQWKEKKGANLARICSPCCHCSCFNLLLRRLPIGRRQACSLSTSFSCIALCGRFLLGGIRQCRDLKW